MGITDESKSGHSDTVESVAITPDGKYIVSGSKDETIKIWELKTGKLVQTIGDENPPVYSIIISPDGKYIISGHGPKNKYDFDQKSTLCHIKIWELETGKLIKTFKGHERAVATLGISSDGKYIVGGSESNFKIWELATGKSSNIPKESLISRAGAISPDGKYIVYGGHDQIINVWERTSAKIIRQLKDHKGIVNVLTFTPDGKYVVGGSSYSIKVWEFETSKVICTIKDINGGRRYPSDDISITMSLDRKYLIIGSEDMSVTIWELPSGNLVRTLNGHVNAVNSVAITSDNKYIVSGADKYIYIWDFLTGKIKNILRWEKNDEIKRFIMNPEEIIQLVYDLESSNLETRLKGAQNLTEAAKNGINIKPAMKIIGNILGDEKEQENIILKIAEALKYYFDNYISYYCRFYNYDEFLEELVSLRSPKVNWRKGSFRSLNGYFFNNNPRGWHYMDSNDLNELIINLKSPLAWKKVQTIEGLIEMVKNKISLFEAVPALRTALIDKNEDVRWGAAEALARYYGQYTPTTYHYYSDTLKHLRNVGVEGKLEAISYYKHIATPHYSDADENDIAYVIPTLTVLLDDDDLEVRKKAMETIKYVQGSRISPHKQQMVTDTIPTIIKILKEEKSDLKEDAALLVEKGLFNKTDISKFIPDLTELLDSELDEVKSGVSEVLTIFYTINQDWKKVESLLNHKDKIVRKTAADKVGVAKYYEVDMSPIIPQLKKLLNDISMEVRLEAAYTLVYHVPKSDILQTIPMFKAALSDPKTEVRLRAVEYFKVLEYKEFDISEVIPDLKILTEDADSSISYNAKDLLKSLKERKKS